MYFCYNSQLLNSAKLSAAVGEGGLGSPNILRKIFLGIYSRPLVALCEIYLIASARFSPLILLSEKMLLSPLTSN